jgi:hypothetical protein
MIALSGGWSAADAVVEGPFDYTPLRQAQGRSAQGG